MRRRPESNPETIERTTAGASPRLHRQVSRILENQIRAGVLEPGRIVLETPVAEQFGVSRAPVRHALEELAQKGLVRKRDGRGYIILAPPGNHPPAEPAGTAFPSTLHAVASWEQIHGDVESAIVSRMAFASWRIVETALGDHYGVSRTVAREVLARLQQVGLVEKGARGHWLASALTRDHIAELYEMRWLLEPEALVKAGSRAPANVIKRLRESHDHALARFPGLEEGELDRLEHQLHVEFLSHSDNRRMIQALRQYQTILIVHHHVLYVVPHTPQNDPFIGEHLGIIHELEQAAPEAAARALERHLKRALDRAVARLEALPASLEPPPLSYLVRIS